MENAEKSELVVGSVDMFTKLDLAQLARNIAA